MNKIKYLFTLIVFIGITLPIIVKLDGQLKRTGPQDAAIRNPLAHQVLASEIVGSGLGDDSGANESVRVAELVARIDGLPGARDRMKLWVPTRRRDVR